MESTKISVIVPVYNAEKYLEKCIESILGQTHTNFELLLINDGSTDRSSEICHRYENDRRVRIFDRENVGVSRTRNFGISKATGDYLLFVDSDDYIEPKMLECLIRTVKETGADCSVCGLIHERVAGSRLFPGTPVKKVTDGIGAVKELLINEIATAGPVCKLFSKQIVFENMFPEDLTVGEDAVGVVDAFLKAGKVAFDTKHHYHYNHREESLTSATFSKRDFDLITAYDRIEEKLLKVSGDLQTECLFRRIWSRFYVLDKALLAKTKKKEYREIYSWLKKHKTEILENPYVGKMRKMAMRALFIHPKLYYFIIANR